jgi:hypothetical protein
MSCNKRTVSSFGIFVWTLTLLTVMPTLAYAGGFVGADILYASVYFTICTSVLAIPALLWAIWLQRKNGAAKLTWKRALVICLKHVCMRRRLRQSRRLSFRGVCRTSPAGNRGVSRFHAPTSSQSGAAANWRLRDLRPTRHHFIQSRGQSSPALREPTIHRR